MEDFLNPQEVIDQLELKSDMVACDFGCGSGGWVLPLAKVLQKGKVYAIDILEEPLSILKGKARTEKLFNIQPILTDVEKGVNIKNESVDLVLMTNLLFEAKDKSGILNEGKRILKEGGKILIVDWKRSAPLGPENGRVLPQEIKELCVERVGLKLEAEFDAGSYHWGLILNK